MTNTVTNKIYEQVVLHLSSGDEQRIAIGVQGGYHMPVYSAKDLPNIKPEGDGLRIGKTFIFACQVKFARTA